MNVLVIPEDFRKDQYMVKPLVERMLAEVGKPNAKVRVCQDPLLGGISEALNWSNINEILDRYPMVQIFLLLVDRDGVSGRRQALDGLETKAANVLDESRVLFGENAWQEIEVWVIAGQRLLKGWNWGDIRSDRDPKENYFDDLVEHRGLAQGPGGGRKTLGREAAAKYTRVRSRCKEDIGALEDRLRQWLEQT
ncbi:MAG: hypothetical protein HQ567_09125 [Candidatus Nealsonbacteria bacterium]|nr:hypothetical protein [Candidatus Nealsonbacteria bacterium]